MVLPQTNSLVVIDIETSGLNPFMHEPLALGIVPVSPTLALERASEYLRSLSTSGLATPVGHNVGFDVAFLRKLAFLAGKEEVAELSHRAIDTHTILYMLYLKGLLPREALSSDGAFRHFDVKPTNGDRHTALGDALATRELLLKALSL